jgi:hypothetical protein
LDMIPFLGKEEDSCSDLCKQMVHKGLFSLDLYNLDL